MLAALFGAKAKKNAVSVTGSHARINPGDMPSSQLPSSKRLESQRSTLNRQNSTHRGKAERQLTRQLTAQKWGIGKEEVSGIRSVEVNKLVTNMRLNIG